VEVQLRPRGGAVLTPEDLLDAAAEAGLAIRVEEGKLTVCGRGSEPVGLIDELQRRAGQIVALLTCARCGATGGRLVPAYWGPKFCPTCCAEVVAENDSADDWPPLASEDWLAPEGWLAS